MGPLWAVAAITFKEAVRKKVFYVVAIFAILVLASTALFPVIDPSQQLHLVELWVHRILTFFAAVMIILMAGTSLPADVESKRIHTILSKPIHKMTFVSGKFLGFTLILFVFIAAMGLISLFYLTLFQLIGEGHTNQLIARPVMTASLIRVEGHADPKVHFWERDKEDPKFSEWILSPHKNREYNLVDNPHIMTTRQIRIIGIDPALTWVFQNLNPSDFDPTLQAEIKIQVYLSTGDPKNPGALPQGYAKIRAINPQTGKDKEVEHHFNSRKPMTLEIPRELISPAGELHLRIGRGRFDPNNPNRPYIIAEPGDVQIYGKSRNFWMNYANGLFLVFLQTMIVMSGTALCSSFISAPMSIFVGLFLLLAGSVHSFTQENVKTTERSLAQREKMAHQHRNLRKDPSELPSWVIQYGQTVSKLALRALPNFDHFDFSSYLQKDLALAPGTMAHGLAHALPFVGAFFILSLLVIRSKDFA